eukprot:COSAG06_NODE_15131_length_1095_cov_2.385542_1_plen_90_part_00
MSTFRNIDFSPIDGSPTLGSSTGPQLERLVGSIETMTDQVNSGMQALASASTGLKGASPDERGISYISVGDLAKAFYHMPIHEDDRYLT